MHMLFAKPLTTKQMQMLAIPVGVKADDASIPDEFGLSQNYPNPFNPQTSVEFQLPKETTVTLKIYNLLGKAVKTILENEKLPAGTYRQTISALDLPSGIYLYRLVTPEFSQTRKMTVLK